MMSLSSVLHDHMALFGYERIRTPIIEPAELFLTKAGDQIIERLLTFTRGGQDYALRPEFTAPAVAHYLRLGKPGCVRWQFDGAVFQDESNGAPRHQSHSIGAELIGYAGAHADAEIIAMAAQGLDKLGITGWQLRIGHVGLTRHLMGQFGADARTLRLILRHRSALSDPALGRDHLLRQVEQALAGQGRRAYATPHNDTDQAEQVVDALLTSSQWGVTLGGRTREDIAQRLIRKHQASAQHEAITQLLDFMARWSAMQFPLAEAFTRLRADLQKDDTEGHRLLSEWSATVALLRAYGIPDDQIIIQPDMARTWDYYTGTVFEIHREGAQLAGGGRYDELARLIGDSVNTPAVGFAYYASTLASLIPAETAPRYLRIADTGDEYAVRWANQLRERGVPVRIVPADPADADICTCDPQHGVLIAYGAWYTADDLPALISAFSAKAKSS